METQENQTATTLQSHITHLTSLVERVNTLRKIPGLLLAPSTLTGSQLEQGFAQINDLKGVVNDHATQECLKQAQSSFSRTEVDINLDGRRQSRKRRRPPSPIPESPRPPPVHLEHIFPPPSRIPPVTLSELPSYIRDQNELDHALKLHIWTPTRPEHRMEVPGTYLRNQMGTIIRISIKDVLYAYVRLDVASTVDCIRDHVDSSVIKEIFKGDRLVIESITVFGPRERKFPHSQSDFVVFQKLSQYVAWMIQAEPEVELQSIVALFVSYESLFVSQCTICHRVLSEEGHFPPVCRIWTPTRRVRDATSALERDSGVLVDDSDGRWEPRHQTCLNGIMRG